MARVQRARGFQFHQDRRVHQQVRCEGAHDDISGVGQTQAAHGLCSGIPADLKELYVHPDVGHYGVFNGGRFRRDIYPRARDFIRRTHEAAVRVAA